MPIEDVVPQDQARTIVLKEIPTHDEGVGEPFRRRLFGVIQFYSDVFSVTKQVHKTRKILWRADEKNISNPR
jgi:hypothetical protein